MTRIRRICSYNIFQQRLVNKFCNNETKKHIRNGIINKIYNKDQVEQHAYVLLQSSSLHQVPTTIASAISRHKFTVAKESQAAIVILPGSP